MTRTLTHRLTLIALVLLTPVLSAQAPKAKAQMDADFNAAVLRLSPQATPVIPCLACLATPSEAANNMASHGGSTAEVSKAYDDAARAQQEAFDAGDTSKLDLDSLGRLQAYKAALKASPKNRCGGEMTIGGATERQVICIMGIPTHINSDLLGGDQLVYAHAGDTYMIIYIDPQTNLVENIQYPD